MKTGGSLLGIEQTLNFISEVKLLNTPEELTRSVKRVTSQYGVVNILAGFIPNAGMLPNQQIGHILLADWPEEWSQIYFRKGLLFKDPTIRRVVKAEPTFTWSDLSKSSDFGSGDQRLMDWAKDFYLGNGCTVPLVSLDGRHAGFSFAGPSVDDSPDAKGVMTLVANFAFGRALELLNQTLRKQARLSPREREVLGWIGLGKTDWEISVIFGVSEKAVSKHVLNARTKLGAVNRAHAVVEAFRLGLIT